MRHKWLAYQNRCREVHVSESEDSHNITPVSAHMFERGNAVLPHHLILVMREGDDWAMRRQRNFLP